MWRIAGSERGVNLWYRSIVPPITMASLAVLAARVRIVTNSSYKNILGSDCFLHHVEAQDYTDGPGVVVTDNTSLSPGFGAPTRVASIALSLKHQVDIPVIGHPFVTYVPGIPQSVIDGNMIDPFWANSMATAWGNYAVNLPIFGWEYVCVSRVAGGSPRGAAAIETVRSTFVGSYVIFNRRMRLPGRPS